MTISKFSTTENDKQKSTENFLRRERARMIEQMKKSSNAERRAVIRHIDGFLQSATPDGRIFWLRVRRQIERQIERTH